MKATLINRQRLCPLALTVVQQNSTLASTGPVRGHLPGRDVVMDVSLSLTQVEWFPFGRGTTYADRNLEGQRGRRRRERALGKESDGES